MLIALIHNWDMHRCTTVFEGEGRGIKSTQPGDIGSEIDDCTGGLDEG